VVGQKLGRQEGILLERGMTERYMEFGRWWPRMDLVEDGFGEGWIWRRMDLVDDTIRKLHL
jgi:hypothetical protein